MVASAIDLGGEVEDFSDSSLFNKIADKVFSSEFRGCHLLQQCRRRRVETMAFKLSDAF